MAKENGGEDWVEVGKEGAMGTSAIESLIKIKKKYIDKNSK